MEAMLGALVKTLNAVGEKVGEKVLETAVQTLTPHRGDEKLAAKREAAAAGLGICVCYLSNDRFTEEVSLCGVVL